MKKHLTKALTIGLFTLSLTASVQAADTAGNTSRYVDDVAITTQIKAKQAEDKLVRATAISVETRNGVVQLSGFSKSEQEKARAEMLAKSVEGVKEVKNDIVVR